MAIIGYQEGPERRRHPRTKKQFMIRFRLYKGASYAGGWHPAVTQDISSGGLYFASTIQFEVSNHLEILMKIPGTPKDIRLVGEVKHCARLSDSAFEMFGVGVEFLDLEAGDKSSLEALRAYLEKVFSKKTY